MENMAKRLTTLAEVKIRKKRSYMNISAVTSLKYLNFKGCAFIKGH